MLKLSTIRLEKKNSVSFSTEEWSVCVNAAVMNYMRMKARTESGGLWIRVNGDCMVPSLMPNSDVLIMYNDSYQVGDIVLREMNDQMSIHRIVCVKGSNVITKGDNAYIMDEPCDKDLIVGKAIRVSLDNEMEKSIPPVTNRIAVGAALSRWSGVSYAHYLNYKTSVGKLLAKWICCAAHYASKKCLFISSKRYK